VRKIKTYNGEVCSAETGEETTYSVDNIAAVLAMVRKLGDGDAITINCQVEDRF